jgi:putative hydrolase of the HAD superfamily
MQIRAILFDFGNVLTHHTPAEAHAVMAEAVARPLPAFLAAYWRPRMAYDRGDISAAAYWDSVLEELSLSGDTALRDRMLQADGDFWVDRLNPAMTQWIPRLRSAGYRVGILSNAPHEVAIMLKTLLPTTDAAIFSCDVRSTKPDAPIYHAAIAGVDAAPEETLFFDDLPVNIEAARQLGLQAHLFTGPEVTQSVLSQLPRL